MTDTAASFLVERMRAKFGSWSSSGTSITSLRTIKDGLIKSSSVTVPLFN